MHSSADDIAISALQHYVYCPRQCALIHLEGLWTENVHTAEGRLLHENAHSASTQKRKDLKVATGLELRSDALKLVGVADVVEFHREHGQWRPYPVEYKRGRAKSHDADRVQLCAQALCLEEMLGLAVPQGALFYGATKRREEVIFDAFLRQRTTSVAAAVHELLRQGLTPPPAEEAAKGKDAGLCRACSLCAQCLPQLGLKKMRASRYLASVAEEV